ncbi:hypothetical protein C8N32_12014 [Rhodovulum imhoffii]|uniref:Uncharacterized protein n=1 Tax=Rhodovulum imhoffii TaxID=365340 RepID=A0A2T5BPE1_9RHOB|nr:hypothetical protein [Rhodovulum imhoffii]MBK5932650.1 hypothetical protein [Rhodovulum imhoffii]PTN00895.1 hypothetical protein C8N32_12014 [Rhodovulum imhoffii]
MPLPLAPFAGAALRYGAVALAVYALRSRMSPAPRDQRVEDALDDLDEGVGLRRDPGQVSGGARLRRTIRLGPDGPGVEVDATAFGRVRLRRV